MNCRMNENVFVKEYEFEKPPIQKIDSIIDNCLGDCHNKYFRTFDHMYVYDINLTNITNIETISLTISGKSTILYELNKKLTVARQNGSVFNQINKLIIKFTLLYQIQLYITI